MAKYIKHFIGAFKGDSGLAACSTDEQGGLFARPRPFSTFLSTPISGINRATEYEAYFAISAAEFERYRSDPDAAEDFLEACRNHGNEDRRLA